MEPQPLSKTDNGGKNIARSTRQILILFSKLKRIVLIRQDYKAFVTDIDLYQVSTYLCGLNIKAVCNFQNKKS